MKLIKLILKKGGLVVPNSSCRPRFPISKFLVKRRRLSRLVGKVKYKFRLTKKKRFKRLLEKQYKIKKSFFKSLPRKIFKGKIKFRRHGYFSTVFYGLERTMRQRYYKYYINLDWEYKKRLKNRLRSSSYYVSQRQQSLGKWGRFWLRYIKKRPPKKFRIRWQRLPKWLLKSKRPRWRRLACFFPFKKPEKFDFLKFLFEVFFMWPASRRKYPFPTSSREEVLLVRLRYWGNNDLTKLVREELCIAKKTRLLQDRHILKNLE